MKRKLYHILFILPFCATSFARIPLTDSNKRASELIQTQSVQFVENKGQMIDMNGNSVPFVLFKTEAVGVNMYITEKGISYVFLEMEEKNKKNLFQNKNTIPDEKIKTKWNRIDMCIKGAHIKKENIITEDQSIDFLQYFLAHCPEGITNVHSYKKITIQEIYPGIDWVLYNSNEKGFKYDFIIHPHADPQQIKIIYSSLIPLELNYDGSVEIKSEIGKVIESAPLSYQNGNNIPSLFIKKGNQKNDNGGFDTQIEFEIGKYNTNETLTIDPQLVWATFYGGSNDDFPVSLVCDSIGNVFLTGYTYSSNFPVLNSGGNSYYVGTKTGSSSADVFILKFDNSGFRLWATYYGGTGDDEGLSICTDMSGNVFISGIVLSPNFPILDPGGGTYYQSVNSGNYDSFILKFDNIGTRLWATYYGGGSGDDINNSICSDSSGNIFLTGYTTSTNFPVFNPGGGTYFQSALAGGMDAFILKFNNTGIRLWATYYGGSGDDQGYSLCSDPSNHIYITGYSASSNFPVHNPGGGTYFQGTLQGLNDAFILKFDNIGTRFWSSYYGGNNSDNGNSICSDFSGNIFILGNTSSIDFPVFNGTSGAYFQGTNAGGKDVFILKFDNSGTRQWATYYGGGQDEVFQTYNNIVIDHCNNIYISFNATSGVPVQTDIGYNDNTANGFGDVFIAKLGNSGALLWATYFGGDGSDYRPALAVDRSANLFLTGICSTVLSNASYPLTDPGGGTYYDGIFDPTLGSWGSARDGFIAKFISPVFNYNPSITPAFCSCNGTASLTSISGGCSSHLFEWYNGNWSLMGNGQTINGLCSGNYQAIIKDPASGINIDTLFVTIPDSSIVANINGINTICSGQNTALTMSGWANYNWSTNATTNSIIVSPLTNTTYSVIVLSGTCVDTAYITISVLPIPIVSISGSDSICLGRGTTLYAIGGSTYSWSIGSVSDSISVYPLSNTTYSVIVSDSGCIDTAITTVFVNQLPIANITGITMVCSGQNVILTASGGGTYNWNTGVNTSNVIVNPVSDTTYFVIVKDELGCADTATIAVHVVPLPIAIISGISTICDGETEILSVSGIGNFLWDTGDTTNQVTASPSITTTYSVTASNICGSNYDSITVNVNSLPVSSLTNDTTILLGSSVNLNATGGVSYIWLPNVGLSCNTCPNPIAAPQSTTSYSVIITDVNGCSVTKTVTITVNDDFEIFVPDVFSPNGDGENDILYVRGTGIKEVNFVVYDRLGEKIFESNDITKGWDGTYKGSPLNSAVFIYYCSATLFNEKKINTKGDITLIR